MIRPPVRVSGKLRKIYIATISKFNFFDHQHLVLRPRNAFMVSLSNHERNCLKSHALRHAQGERIMRRT